MIRIIVFIRWTANGWEVVVGTKRQEESLSVGMLGGNRCEFPAGDA